MLTLKLSTRLALGYVAAIAALIFVVATMLVGFQMARIQTAAVHDNFLPSIDVAKRLLVRLERMENAEFMYFVPGQQRRVWLERFEQAASEFEAAYLEAEVLAHTSTEVALYARMGRHYGAFMHIDGRMRRQLAAGQVEEARALNATESIEAIGELRKAAREFYDLNLNESNRARAEADEALGRLGHLALLVGGLGVAVAAWHWRRATLALVGPVRALQEATEALGAGQDVRVAHPAATWTIELAALQADFNKMAGELRGARLNLEGEVQARTLALRDANTRLTSLIDDLRSLDRMKSNLLAVVSHELMTPLNIIMGYADLLADDLAGPLTPEQRAAVGEVTGATERLTRMVRNTLLYARLESDEVKLVGAAFQPNELLVAAAARAANAAEAIGVQVSLSAPVDLPSAWADPERLSQVLDELIDNAIKFAGAGGHVRLGATADEASVSFEVADDGPGLPEEALDRLFQPFFQLDLSSTREHGGLGLGLAVAKRLVARMGGVLMAFSSPQGGATFRFTVPRSGRLSTARREVAEVTAG